MKKYYGETKTMGEIILIGLLGLSLLAQGELDENKMIYKKDQLNRNQFKRIRNFTRKILKEANLFENYSEEVHESENGEDIFEILLKDKKGLAHTCYFKFIFVDGAQYEITNESCMCEEVNEWFSYLSFALLASDITEILVSCEIPEKIPQNLKDRWDSAIDMYYNEKYQEAWTHVCFIAEQITRSIYRIQFGKLKLNSKKNPSWKSLLNELEKVNHPVIQHQISLLDSIRPLRNLTTHEIEYKVTLDDVEFGIRTLSRVINFLE